MCVCNYIELRVHLLKRSCALSVAKLVFGTGLVVVLSVVPDHMSAMCCYLY